MDAQSAPDSRLSGGQRARRIMLTLWLAQPTNHLDIEGQQMLRANLVEHGAA